MTASTDTGVNAAAGPEDRRAYRDQELDTALASHRGRAAGQRRHGHALPALRALVRALLARLPRR